MEEIDCAADAPCFEGEFARWIYTERVWRYNTNTYVLAKTTKGDLVYKRKGLSWCSPDSLCWYIFTRNDLPVDANGDTLELEYLQLVAFPGDLASNWDTWRIKNALDSIYGSNVAGDWYSDKESAVKVDSMMNILVDKDGNPKDGLWIMSKRLTFKQE